MNRQIGWHKHISVLVFSLLPAIVSAQPVVWTTGSLQRTGPTDAAGSGTYVQLSAGRGEYESFQIVVQAPSAGLSNVNVNISNLNGPGGAVIPGSAFTLYREQYVYVNQSSPNWLGTNQPLGVGWYPDGLIPFNDPSTGLPITGAKLEAVPFSLTAAKNQPIWIDLLVPRTATPGAYTGTFTVTSNQGNVTGTIALTVWHFTLPMQPSLRSSFLFWSADSTAAEEELLRNRIQPLRAPANIQSTLISNYGLNSVALPYYSGADISDCTMSTAPSVSDFASAAASEQPGLYQYDYSADEINDCPTLFPTVKQWGLNMHQAGVRNLVTMNPNPALYDDGSGTNHSAVDIWTMLPIGYDATVSQMPVVLAKGDSLWSYNTVVQDSYSPKWEIDFAPINYRIQPGFISQSLNLTGLLYWRVDYWSSDPWNQVNNTGTFSGNNYPGEAMLVYPGAQVGISGVAPSMRLKWLRDGVEDYEYVQMLKNAGQSSFALGLAASVGPDWTNWTRDPNQIANVRLQLGQALDQLSTAPAAVSAITPTAGATNVSVTPSLSWSASTGATSYSVYFGTSASPALATTTSNTGFTPGTLTSGTTYYWSVTATNANGSTPSATWSFTTAAALPSAPTGLSPAGATGVSVTPTLTWSGSSGATSYGVYFGSSLVATVTGTSFSPATLTNSTTYSWSVVATNATGSTASALASFTTVAALPSAPSGLSPAGATGVSVTPTLTWSASSGAASYGVYIGSSLVATVTGTSYSPAPLANNTPYSWKVIATNAAGSTASAMASFTTVVALPSAPSGLSPAGATGVSVTPTLTWSASSGAASYGVYIGSSLVATVTGTSYSPATLTHSTTYSWKVVATNAAGSAASAVASFTTIAALPTVPSTPSPANGANGIATTPTLTWKAGTGAASYSVYFGSSSTPALAATVNSASYSPGTLAPGTTYYWSVVATNAAGNVSSPTWSFTTAAATTSGNGVLAPVVIAPVVDFVTPSSGSGTTANLQITIADWNGYSDLSGAGTLINSSLNGANACWFYYDLGSKTISLASDSTLTWSSIPQGSASTISNSQCSITGTSVSSVAITGGATISVTVTFNRLSFAGSKNIYVVALSNEGLSSGYQPEGAWTVQ